MERAVINKSNVNVIDKFGILRSELLNVCIHTLKPRI